MPPTVLVSRDREDVERRLRTGPTLNANPPPVVTSTITWITAILTSLLNYVTYFIGDNSDQIMVLKNRISELEENVASTSAQQTIPTPTQHEPLHPPSRRARCKRCHALGHDTNDCRSKDPVAIKKRVANNQKARKRTDTIQPPTIPTPYTSPTDFYGHPLFMHNSMPTSSPQALVALATDAKELRRRKVQSTRDKRRRGAVSTNKP